MKKSRVSIDQSNWIVNLSYRTLTQKEEILKKGMKVAPSPSRIPKKEILAKVEGTLFGYANQEIAEEARARIACLIKSAKIPKRNVSKEEWKAISSLRKDKDVVILEADKGNATGCDGFH